MLTDPDEVARLAGERQPAYIRLYDALAPRLHDGDAGLTARFDQITAEVAAQIDCTTCGRCCRHVGPRLEPGDIERLCRGLDISPAALRRRYLRPMWPGASEEDQVWLLPDPCPLHDGLLCTIYEHRPQVCRDFPQAIGPDPAERLSAFVESARYCPIAFNVLELLGDETLG